MEKNKANPRPLTYEEVIKKHQNWTQEGFTVQFNCYILYLLKLNWDDEITYETEDDIVINKADGKYHLLMQVKSTVENNTDLTDLDSELWKSIGIWMEQYNSYLEKEEYFRYRKFYIVTNKKNRLSFYQDIIDFQEKHLATDQKIVDDLNLLSKKTKQKDIKDVIKKIRTIPNEHRLTFFNNFSVIYIDNPQEAFYNYFLKTYYLDPNTDMILDHIIMQMKRKQGKEKLCYTKEKWNEEFSGILHKTDRLPRTLNYDSEKLKVNWPNDVSKMNMVKQLKSISVVDDDDDLNDDLFIDIMTSLLYYKQNLAYWQERGLTYSDQITELENIAIKNWQVQYNKIHLPRNREIKKESLTEDDSCKLGLACYTNTMVVQVENYNLTFSDGCYIDLSNEDSPRVHWRWDYKKFI
jgi:hypothetical protein